MRFLLVVALLIAPTAVWARPVARPVRVAQTGLSPRLQSAFGPMLKSDWSPRAGVELTSAEAHDLRALGERFQLAAPVVAPPAAAPPAVAPAPQIGPEPPAELPVQTL